MGVWLLRLRRELVTKLGDRPAAEVTRRDVVQDGILNHVDSSVSAIYDRHRYDGEARAWLQKWADHVDALRASNVVPLRAA